MGGGMNFVLRQGEVGGWGGWGIMKGASINAFPTSKYLIGWVM